MIRSLAFAAGLLLASVPAYAQFNGLLPVVNTKPFDAALASNGARAYWKMEEPAGCAKLVDILGGNNATPGTGITCGGTGLVTGDTGTSTTFNGAGCAPVSGSAFTFDYTQPFWVSGTFNLNVTRSGGFRGYTLIGKQSLTSPFPGWSIGVNWDNVSTAESQLLIDMQANQQPGVAEMQVATNFDLSNAQHTFLLTYSGSGTAAGVKLIVDGVQNQTTIHDGLGGNSILGGSAPAEIGCRDGNAGWGFNGSVQKLAFGLGAYPAGAGATGLFPLLENQYQASLKTGAVSPFIKAGAPLIIDNDKGDDPDNAADTLLAGKLANAGSLNLAGDIVCSSLSADVTAERAFLNNLGLGSTPLYHYTGTGLPTVDTYAAAISTKFNGSDLPSNYGTEVTGYRTIVHSWGTTRGIIYVSGPLTCLDNFLASGADGIDSRTGAQMIAQNVAAVVIVAGFSPSNGAWSQSADFNMASTPTMLASTRHLIANWPSTVPIIQYGIEQDQVSAGVFTPTQNAVPSTGPSVLSASATNPFLDAFNDASAQLNGTQRPAWGQPPLLWLTGQYNGHFRFNAVSGTETVDASGNNSWATTAGFWSILGTTDSPAAMTTLLKTVAGWQ